MQDKWDWFSNSQLTKGQETQLRIMKAALKLFGQSGFHSVTLKNIAQAAKTSHPLILKHFGDKENLLLAVRKYVSDHNHQWVDSRIKPSMSGFERCLVFCFENINWAFHQPDLGKIILLTYYYGSLGKSTVGVNAIKLGAGRLHEHVLQAQREGLVDSGLPLSTVSQMIHEYAVGLFIKMLVVDSGRSKKLSPQYKKKLQLFISQYLST